eukprot:GHUV01039223.1.p1 GENE.GHUV01039223.1~~GHUV01039223.1.p1  ORF type:complete len:114 (-),score=12.20 GHUV01039223.1:815-1156(-)
MTGHSNATITMQANNQVYRDVQGEVIVSAGWVLSSQSAIKCQFVARTMHCLHCRLYGRWLRYKTPKVIIGAACYGQQVKLQQLIYCFSAYIIWSAYGPRMSSATLSFPQHAAA